MDIKILGPGCHKCQQTEKLLKEVITEVAKEVGLEAQIEKVTDLMEIAGYGVLGTPAVVMDGEVKSVGKIPTKDEIRAWLGK